MLDAMMLILLIGFAACYVVNRASMEQPIQNSMNTSSGSSLLEPSLGPSLGPPLRPLFSSLSSSSSLLWCCQDELTVHPIHYLFHRIFMKNSAFHRQHQHHLINHFYHQENYLNHPRDEISKTNFVKDPGILGTRKKKKKNVHYLTQSIFFDKFLDLNNEKNDGFELKKNREQETRINGNMIYINDFRATTTANLTGPSTNMIPSIDKTMMMKKINKTLGPESLDDALHKQAIKQSTFDIKQIIIKNKFPQTNDGGEDGRWVSWDQSDTRIPPSPLLLNRRKRTDSKLSVITTMLPIAVTESIRNVTSKVSLMVSDQHHQPPMPLNHQFTPPIYEISINEEEKNLPKKLFQVKAIMMNESRLQPHTHQNQNSEVRKNPLASLKSQQTNQQQPSNNQEVMFILSGNGVNYEHPEQSKFAINAFTGELFLIAPIDRDPPTGHDVWRLNITAEDDRSERINGSITIIVRVKDINDNLPYFNQQTYRANVSENLGSNVDLIKLNAIDRDSDSIVRYSIEMNRVNSDGELIFDIDELSGQISTAVCCLDRESINQYLIKVCATDRSISGSDQTLLNWSQSVSTFGQQRAKFNQSSCTNVVIDVNDENDEKPRLVRDQYFLSLMDGGIQEMSPARLLLNTTVQDLDKPETNNFTCRLSGSLRFALRPVEPVLFHDKTDQEPFWLFVHNQTVNQSSSFSFRTEATNRLISKMFQCEISKLGNVRILVRSDCDQHCLYQTLLAEHDFYFKAIKSHSLKTYNKSLSKIITENLTDHLELELKILISDVGYFESKYRDDIGTIESHLTSAVFTLRISTQNLNFGDWSSREVAQRNESSVFSQTVVTNKQHLSPDSYNSRNDRNGNFDFANSKTKFGGQTNEGMVNLHEVFNLIPYGSLVFYIGLCVTIILSLIILALLLIFRRSRDRHNITFTRKFGKTLNETCYEAPYCLNNPNGSFLPPPQLVGHETNDELQQPILMQPPDHHHPLGFDDSERGFYQNELTTEITTNQDRSLQRSQPPSTLSTTYYNVNCDGKLMLLNEITKLQPAESLATTNTASTSSYEAVALYDLSSCQLDSTDYPLIHLYPSSSRSPDGQHRGSIKRQKFGSPMFNAFQKEKVPVELAMTTATTINNDIGLLQSISPSRTTNFC